MFSTILAAAFFLAASAGNAAPTAHPPAAASPRPPGATARDANFTQARPAHPYLSADEQELIDRINAARTERGLYALTPDPTLVQDARNHSQDMAALGYFSHTAPAADRRSPMDRYLDILHAAHQSAPNYLLIGENIYYCSVSRGSQDIAFAHQTLMNSPGHRANILDPRYGRVGVGVYRSATGEIWVTEVFLRRN